MTTPEELDALPVELSVAQTKIIDLRARVAELERYGDPTFYTNRLHIAESSLGKAAEYAAELRQKLQSANGRANAAEARASSEQKKREAAEAELARRGQGVQVKALVWEPHWTGGREAREFAQTSIGADYHVNDEGWWQPQCAMNLCKNRSDAKSAAQADYEARIRAALVSPGDGWRSMDSAPRGGTRFLAYEGRRGCYECWWQHDLLEWEGWQDDWDSEPEPTAWMPLPAPPASEGADHG